jgi:hypothetical protein
MSLFVRSTLCVTPLVYAMWVVAAAGLLNSWPSWLWIRQRPSTPLLITISAASKAFCFFPLFFSLYRIHFPKKQNLRKVSFWMLPIPIKISFWTVVLWNIMQFPMDISMLDTGKYRKLVLTGYIWRPWPGGPGPELIYVLGLEIVYLLMYFWTRTKVTEHVVTYIASLVFHPNILSVSFRGFNPSRGPRFAEIFVSFLSLLLGLLD